MTLSFYFSSRADIDQNSKCTLSNIPLINRFLVLGSDYDLALQEIAYYRVCHEKSQLIQDYVTFHLYAEIKYADQLDINSWPEVNCEKWTSAADSVTFKQGEYYGNMSWGVFKRGVQK